MRLKDALLDILIQFDTLYRDNLDRIELLEESPEPLSDTSKGILHTRKWFKVRMEFIRRNLLDIVPEGYKQWLRKPKKAATSPTNVIPLRKKSP